RHSARARLMVGLAAGSTGHRAAGRPHELGRSPAPHRIVWLCRVRTPNALPAPRGYLVTVPTVLLIAADAGSVLIGGLDDASAIFGVAGLNVAIGFTVESRPERTIRLLGVRPERAAGVLRDGKRLVAC